MEDNAYLKHAKDCFRTCLDCACATSTEFLSLYEQHETETVLLKEASVYGLSYHDLCEDGTICFTGGFSYAERKIIQFVPLGVGESRPTPICVLLIEPKNPKFAREMTHRDYLGSILALGIERKTIGDILVNTEGNCAYVFCLEKISGYILESLTSVSNNNVSVRLLSSDEISETEDLFQPKFKEIKTTVSGLRLDCILSAAYKKSRSGSADLIRSESVFVNGKMISNPSHTLKEGDVVSARGFGKFLFSEVSGTSNKDRIWVILKLYQ